MTSSLTLDQRTAALDAIAGEIRVCTKCPLHQGRTKAVPGDGPYTADIMFIGEGPGFHEDQQGLPFVGASGRLLEEMLAVIGLNRKQVFITNVVKCRPPENRDPMPNEMGTCVPTYLNRQIELINPKVIVTLGRYSMGLFFPNAKISAIHGKPKWENNRAYLPMFHPAAVLRSMDTMKTQYEIDFKKLPGLVEEALKRVKPATPPHPLAGLDDSPAAEIKDTKAEAKPSAPPDKPKDDKPKDEPPLKQLSLF
ncbi:MAG: uracil-DNA glycosylase [Anaerolineae bacterium]|nr:uracil-DNA glycosylase [Anaerolineae bacterium]